MNRNRLKLTGIATKLILMNVALLTVFAAMGLLILYSFADVEQMVNKTIATDVGKNMANAAALRELSGIFAQTGQLLGTFIKNDKELGSQGNSLVKAVERMAGNAPDPRLELPLRSYAEKLRSIFASCARINAIILEIERQEKLLHKEHEALESAISDTRIDLIIKGHDPAIMEQLAVLATGYHDSLQAISLSFFRLISEKSDSRDSSSRKELLAMLDDLVLRLQTLTASEPQIAVYGPRLTALADGYRESVTRFYTAMDVLKRESSQLEVIKGQVLGFTQQIDGEIAASTSELSKSVHAIMVSSRRNLLLAFLALILTSGVSTVAFIIFTIRKPMEVINRGIESIAAGDLDTEIKLERHDEWIHIEKGLNHMTAELKRSYSELARQHDHLEEMVRERTRELEETQSELVKREKLAVLGQLTATVSHELRNPLGVIRSSAYYLQNRLGDGDDKVVKHLERIEQHVCLCDGIVADLLEFTRGRLSEKAMREFNPWLEQVLDAERLPAGTVLERSLAPQLPQLRFDPDKLRRVVQNLIGNAVNAIAARAKFQDGFAPRIAVTTLLVENTINLIVEDNGAGMDGATLEKAFEPFFTTRAQGTGLGLAIVRKIVEEHGGAITIASTLGSGTRVVVKLPVEA